MDVNQREKEKCVKECKRDFLESQHVDNVYFCIFVCDNDVFACLPLCVYTQECVCTAAKLCM